MARENFAQFVAAGAKLGHQEEFYLTGKGGILGSEEFVDETIHRLGETDGRSARTVGDTPEFDGRALVRIAAEHRGQTCNIANRGFDNVRLAPLRFMVK